MKKLAMWGLVVFMMTSAFATEPRGVLFAQNSTTCPELVLQALETVDSACAAIGRNEACYGNTRVRAVPDTLAFETPGDLINLANLESLALSSMDVATQDWGISLMNVQASLPDKSAASIDLLLFGNVEIFNQGEEGSEAPSIRIDVRPAAANNINIRSTPSTSGAIVGTLAPDAALPAIGRNEAGDWFQVELAEGVYGWVFAELVTGNEDLSALPVVDASAPVQPAGATYSPMQKFAFQSGLNDRPCEEAPDSGILIQTPQGQGEITFLVNEISISLGSTAYLQAVWGNGMQISVIEGQARVSDGTVTVLAPAGSQVFVPLDANGTPIAPPLGPVSYLESRLASLPIALLEEPVAVAPALTEEEIGALLESQQRLSEISLGGVCGLGPVTMNVTFPPQDDPTTQLVAHGIGQWTAQAGVTATFEAGGNTRLVNPALYSDYLRLLPITNGISDPDAAFATSGGSRSLTYTFTETTLFEVEVAGTFGDNVTLTVTCE